MRFEMRMTGLWIYRGEKSPVFLNLEETAGLRRFLEGNHRSLRPGKRWDLCPYEGHANDCDCNGMGGDR